MDRAEERAGPEDVGDQALMRGLVTAFPFVRSGLSLSGSGVDHVIGHVDSSGVPLPVVPPSLLHDYVLLVILFRGLQRRGLGPVEPS
jgi:hypothetical protein